MSGHASRNSYNIVMSCQFVPRGERAGGIRVTIDPVDDYSALHAAGVVIWDADAWRFEILVVSVEFLDLYVHAPAFEHEPIALFLSESDLLWGHGSWKFDV